MVTAWQRGDAVGLDRALRRVDQAVTAALDLLKLPRGPGAIVQIGHYGRGWIGRVALDGGIRLDAEQVRHFVFEERQPDRIFHTWVHESLHARAPAAATRGAEAERWKGYEEGLVEGLARLVTASAAGVKLTGTSYEFYVASYRALASAVGVDVENLWRELWSAKPGEVRAHFSAMVDLVRQRHGAAALDGDQRRRLGLVGDRVMATERANDDPSEIVLARLWEAVFR
jgi:hypothetical protein